MGQELPAFVTNQEISHEQKNHHENGGDGNHKGKIGPFGHVRICRRWSV